MPRSFAFVLIVAAASTSLAAKPANKISFRKQVWPIFKRHCWGCHNARDAKGGLNMDTVKTTMRGGETGAALAPGKPQSSLLVEMISGPKPDMPKKQPPLSKAKIAIIRQWIQEGAKDDSLPSDTQLKVRIPKAYRFAPAISAIAVHPAGKLVAAACRSEVVIWSLNAGKPQRIHRIATNCDLVTNVAFSPAGNTLAISGGSPSRFGEVTFIKVGPYSEISRRRIGTDTLFRGGFSPDGKTLALGGADGAVHLIPVNAKAKASKIDLHSDWVMDVAYSLDGKLLVSAGRDKATKVSSPQAKRLLRQLDSSGQSIMAVTSGKLLAVAGGSDRRLLSYTYKVALQSVTVTGSGNGSRPVSRRGQYTKALETQAGQVFDLASDATSKTVAVVGDFGELRLYDTTSRKRITTITNIPRPAFCVAMSGDGKVITVGTKSGKVLVYTNEGKPITSIDPVPLLATASTK